MSLRTRLILLLCMPLLASCDMLYDVLDIPDPTARAASLEAEGRAIGGGCRHSGRALEDCYILNPQASKAAVFAGWREMNDYMVQNNLTEVPASLIPPGQPPLRRQGSGDAASPGGASASTSASPAS